MVPQVCVGDTAFPIATAVFRLDEPEVTEINLPVVSCAIKGNGQIACISSMDYLQPSYFALYDTPTFFKQLTHMIASSQRTFARTYCIGFSRQDIRNFKQAFEAMGLFIEGGDFPQTLSHHSIIILSTSLELSEEQMDQLYSFVAEEGKGIMVFYNPNEDAPNVNDFLMRFGLRFTNLIITDDVDSIEVTQNFEQAHALTFQDISQRYIDMISKKDIPQDQLDELVTSLRIYVLACGDENTPRLSELLDASWDFLKRTNYIQNDKLFPIVQQSIVSMLMLDLLQKLPLELLKPVDGYEIFPGKTGEVQMGDFEMELTINSQEWTSTGLWLPAGIIASVTIQNPPPSILIQIGCHSEKNLSKDLPWARWPSTIVTEGVAGDVTNVGSPFGGIVYLMVGEEEEMESFTVHATFQNFCQCPRFLLEYPDVWEETKDNQVPWGEIETSNTILTMPSESMREMDIEPFSSKLDKLIGHVKEYIGIEWEYKFRIVFDIMCEVGKPEISYPIVFHILDIPKIVESVKNPDSYIMNLLTAIAFSILQTIGIDESTKIAISAVAASNALSEEFPDFSPMLVDGIELPPLFHELWEINTKHDKTVIPRVIQAVRNTVLQSDVPDDMWISFVRTLSDVGGKNFSSLLTRTRPIPLSVINSLSSLQPYQM